MKFSLAHPSSKTALVNAALALVSLAIAYFVISFVVFRFALPALPLYLRPHFPDIAEALAQTSKAGTLPYDYVALLGDSYAEGQGDNLLAAGSDRGKVFHSAHEIHRITGRDVISLGIGGAGSAQAMVRMPARILRDGCYLYPTIELPSRFLVYFFEGNDLDENDSVTRASAPAGNETRSAIERYVAATYAVRPRWRCYTDLGDTLSRMAAFLLTNRESWKTLRKPSASNRILVNGIATPTPVLQKPPMDLSEGQVELSFQVFDVSLGWLRRNFPGTPTTVVYLPSPAAVYRHAGPEVDAYTHWPDNEVSAFPVGAIEASSQWICERIRSLSLVRAARFIDMRPVLRAAAAVRPLHGPRDWNHFNDDGYRLLGATLAKTLHDDTSTPCADWDRTGG